MNKLMGHRFPAFFLLLFLYLPFSAYAQLRSGYSDLNDSWTVAALKKHVSFISSPDLAGRKPGSEGEKETAAYIYDKLKEYGVDMLCGKEGEVFGISKPSGDTLTSRNIIGFIQGYDPSLNDKYIVVGARMDNLGSDIMKIDGQAVERIYYGANGNASGLAMLLELARMAASNSIIFRRSVLFVAFGASQEGFAGSWYFLNRSFSDAANIEAMINLDMLGSGSGFYAYTSSNPGLDKILRRLSSSLQPILPELTANEPYPSDHRAFYSKEIPSVFFTTGTYPEHGTPKDIPSILDYGGMEKKLEYIFNFLKETVNTDEPPKFSSLEKEGEDNRRYSFYDCDQKPSFMGRTDPAWFITKWIYQYLRYPEAALKEGTQGRVHVEFAIDKDGSVRDARIVKGVSDALDEEVLRVINASPSWKPGRKDGRKVKSYITIPVDFILKKKNNKRK